MVLFGEKMNRIKELKEKLGSNPFHKDRQKWLLELNELMHGGDKSG